MQNKKYSIVLPSYSEAENLQILLPRLIAVADQHLHSYQIIVVDRHVSTDNTKEICDTFNVNYVNRGPNDFYGDAVRTGIETATSEFAIFMDSDGSHSPEFLPELLQYINHHDLLIASRYIDGGLTENSFYLVAISKLLNVTYSSLLKIKCHDISNSFRIYKTAQLKQLTLNCKNFDIIQEILYLLIRNNKNFSIKEVPFSFKKRIYGNSKRSMLVFVMSYFKTLVKLLFMYRVLKK